jgi:hypothetical protein
MSLLFIHRPPTPREVEKLRLILSVYQDGTGMLQDKKNSGRTLPGWRDFERAVALALGGFAPEDKAVFDALLTEPDKPDVKYGLSCKMRGELDRIERDGRVTIELSNSSKKFWAHLKTKRINEANYKGRPRQVGIALVELVETWHQAASLDQGGGVDIASSSYLALSWNKKGWYQLHWFSLQFPDPENLKWYFPTPGHLSGDDDLGTVFEWYGESGGQLKYYPQARGARWASERFHLESLPDSLEHGILAKVAAYFPERWSEASKLPLV